MQLFAAKGQCFGGVARLKKAVDDLKKKHENVIFVNAGDFYQGSVLYSKFKWKVAVEFANMLNFTAMVSHGSYKLIIILEKCGHPHINVFHIK